MKNKFVGISNLLAYSSVLILLAVFNFFVTVNYLHAQSGWFFQNPLPTNNNIQSIDFKDANTGYIAGSCNAVIKTTDGGLSWLPINPRPSSYSNIYYGKIQFIDNNIGYLMSNQSILKTSNGGYNWVLVNSAGATSMYFTSFNTGYAQNWNYVVIRTTDGGVSWSNQSNLGSRYVLHFINEATGYGGGGNIIKTTNGGLNWFSQTGTGLGIQNFFFINNATGYASGSLGRIFRTTNGGDNWTTQYSNGSYTMQSISFIDSNTGFVTGSFIMVKTIDGGNNWFNVPNMQSYSLNSISFANTSTGYLSGANGSHRRFFKTTDAGDTWLIINRGDENTFWDIYFPSQNTGFSVGYLGSIVRTTNSGNDWATLNSGVSSHLYAVYFTNDLTGNIVGEAGVILKTTNGGLNWINQFSGVVSLLTCIFFTNSSTGYISGSSGTILKTTNGGNNWNPLSPGISNSINSIRFFDDNTGFAAGSSYILKTINAGQSWQVSYMSNLCNFRSIFYTSDQISYISGTRNDTVPPGFPRGYVIKTTNSGNTWSGSYLGLGSECRSIKFTDSNTGYINGGYFTTDGGNNWNLSSCFADWSLNTVFFTSANTGYQAGFYGQILKTTDAGGVYVGVGRTEYITPKNFQLHQNYPNPFNPLTKIKYELPRDVKVVIKIYDILGREVRTLMNEFKKAGYYDVTFDGVNLATGVYFYRIEAGEFIQSKKMVLLR